MAGLLACTNLPADPTSPTPQPPTDPVSTEVPAQPPLTAEQLIQAEADLQEQIQVSLDLLGVGATIIPTVSEEVSAYRQAWAELQPEVAPFLGSWTHLNDLQPDQLVVFPSAIANQVCVVDHQARYQYELPLDATEFSRVTTAPADEMSIFSSIKMRVVEVKDGQAQTDRLQFHEDLMQPITANWAPISFEFLGVVASPGQVGLYASVAPPTVNADWPAEIAAQLAEQQCQTDLPE